MMITVSKGHDVKEGHTIRIVIPEHRWWMRFWYWLADRKPEVVQYRTVTSVTDTTLTIEQK